MNPDDAYLITVANSLPKLGDKVPAYPGMNIWAFHSDAADVPVPCGIVKMCEGREPGDFGVIVVRDGDGREWLTHTLACYSTEEQAALRSCCKRQQQVSSKDPRLAELSHFVRRILIRGHDLAKLVDETRGVPSGEGAEYAPEWSQLRVEFNDWQCKVVKDRTKEAS
jgi:hypothetical protein